MFPVTVSPALQINALYDTGTARSCMSYETFFTLGLDLDDRTVPQVCTASGTDMGAVGYTTFDFQINGHPFTQQFIVCHRQTRPLILSQDFSIHYHAGCSWTDYGTKRFKTRGRLIMEIEEPEASKYLPVQKSIKILPRHYAVTHLYCKKPKGLVSIKPDQAFRRDNPSAWIDTHYMDPRHDKTAMSTVLTTGPQVHDIEINEVGSESIQGPNGSDMDSDISPPGPLQEPALQEGAAFEATPITLPQVSPKEDSSLHMLDEKETMSSDKTLMQDKSDTSGKSKQEFIKIPCVIYNLDAHDYVINALQPMVIKADSKAKRNFTLHLLPNIDHLYAQLKGAKIFTTLDLRSGYYHIELGQSSHAKTAFVTLFGKYDFNMVLFGLAQAPTYFQALINKVLKGLHKFAMAYLDDIIIFSKSEEEHLEHLRIIFQRLKAAGLKLKRSKCDFMKKHIQYLGHLILDEGIQPLPEKLESIKTMPAPRNTKEIK